MKKNGNILIRLSGLALVIAVGFAMPAMADWASVESADFSLNTTVPEPCTSFLLFVFAAIFAMVCRRKNNQ